MSIPSLSNLSTPENDVVCLDFELTHIQGSKYPWRKDSDMIYPISYRDVDLECQEQTSFEEFNVDKSLFKNIISDIMSCRGVLFVSFSKIIIQISLINVWNQLLKISMSILNSFIFQHFILMIFQL